MAAAVGFNTRLPEEEAGPSEAEGRGGTFAAAAASAGTATVASLKVGMAFWGVGWPFMRGGDELSDIYYFVWIDLYLFMGLAEMDRGRLPRTGGDNGR